MQAADQKLGSILCQDEAHGLACRAVIGRQQRGFPYIVPCTAHSAMLMQPAHPVGGMVRREQGLQVVAADVGGRAPVEHGGGVLQQSHRHVAVAEAQPLEQEAPA